MCCYCDNNDICCSWHSSFPHNSILLHTYKWTLADKWWEVFLWWLACKVLWYGQVFAGVWPMHSCIIKYVVRIIYNNPSTLLLPMQQIWWAVWHSFGAYICHCSTSSKVAVWQHLVDYAWWIFVQKPWCPWSWIGWTTHVPNSIAFALEGEVVCATTDADAGTWHSHKTF